MSHPFDLDAFVKDYRYPLHLVQDCQVVARNERGLTLCCTTMQFERRWRDRYGTLVEIGVPTTAGTDVMLSIEFVNDVVLRMKMRPGNEPLPDNLTPMLDDSFDYEAVKVRFSEDSESFTMHSTTLTVRIERKPWHIIIQDAEGCTLFETLPAQVYQHPPTGESHLDGASITDAWPWFFRDLFPLGFLRDDRGQTQTFFTATLRHDEHVYGFGEKFSDLDKRGQAINLWHANATGNTWPASYKNVPFFTSTRGYGLFLNSAYPIKYHMGDLSHTHYSVHLQHDLLDVFFIYGPSIKEILPRYTNITGRSPMPPLWSFGLWMSRMSYREQAQVEQVADDLRARDIPCDVIHIDTDWFKTPWANDLTFSSERFPDPSAMIAHLRSRGFRLTLWQIPYIATESVFYAEARENGYFARQDDGQPWLIDGFFGKAAVIDYSNPDAVAWIQSKFEPLFAMGVAAIKTDFGEGAPPQAHYATVDGLAMHNLYPLLYNRAIFEKTAASTGEGIVWGRSAYAGSQRYPLQWGGDPAALWADLANLWHGGLGLGLCGFPFWSVDIGGFGGTPTPELYIRWAQAGLFVSHPRAHGPIAREPWAFGPDAERIFRRYAKLRYALMPYVWSEAHHAVNSSTPMLRPLVLDWQSDPTTFHIDDQFCFGRALLVAPILDEGTLRKVYLPQGQWYDYWTDAVIDCTQGGRWINVQANLEELPLFVRGGALLAACADAPHTGAQDWSSLTVDIYDGPAFQQTLVDKDGTSTEVSYQQGQVSLRGGAARHYTLRLHTAQDLRQAQVNTTDGQTVTITL